MIVMNLNIKSNGGGSVHRKSINFILVKTAEIFLENSGQFTGCVVES